jgi:NleD-like pathogen effector protein (putative zinc metallopeptidase)
MGGFEPNPVGTLSRPDWLAGLQKKIDEAIREKEAAARRRGPFGISEGAWQNAVHQVEINKLLDRITTGKSSIAFDAAVSQEFKDKQIAFLKELAQTPAGFKMMSDLDASKFKTTIGPGNAGSNQTFWGADSYLKADGTPGKGADATIKMNPALTTFAKAGEEEKPWMTEREKYGLYHEMVHAWHSVHGTIPPGQHQGVDNSEWQATGFGPYTSGSVSDNIIRDQMGKEQRPGYAGKVFDATAH